MAHFSKLFEPGEIGKLHLKNRIIFPPMITRYYTADALVSEQMIHYYAERAGAGCALVVVESGRPRSEESAEHRLFLDNDEVISGLRRLVEEIHHGGAKAGMEVNPHRARKDVDPASASEYMDPMTGIKVRALTIAELDRMKDVFVEAVRRTKEAGFDCIVIHGGHGYLIAEFLSPRTNRRNDDYGGDAKKRARFAVELVGAVKKGVGADFPIIFRMMASERIRGGLSLDDAIIAAKLLEEAGVDAIDIVSGSADTYAWVVPYKYMPLGCNTPLSQAIKKEVKIPVSVAGRINGPYVAEVILREGKADFVDIGRALIADPQFISKAIEKRVGDICKCIACCRCAEAVENWNPMVCAVNPAAGREREFELGLKPSHNKKRVLVIGGGPGGMETATVAAQRGHKVTLFDKGWKLGGSMLLAAVFNSELSHLITYMRKEIQRLPIEIKLGKEVTPALVEEMKPDVVVLASGVVSPPSAVPDSGRNDVFSLNDAQALMSSQVKRGFLWRLAALFLKYFYGPSVLRWLLRFNFPFKKRVVIIGGGFGACEIAEVLAEKGKKVTIIETLPEIASELLGMYAELVVSRLKERGVQVFTGVKEMEITQKGVEIVDKDRKRVSLEANNIIIATGFVPDKSLFEPLKGKVSELYEVGDCVQARRIHEAIYEGATVALQI